MQQVYKAEWPSDRCRLGHNDVAVCAWSSTNLFAFTTEKEVKGGKKQYVNVLNPNQPWDIFSSPYKGGEITCLQWDHTGMRFLSGDSNGLCCVWSMVNSMSNVWATEQQRSTDLKGEEILAVGWLHSGAQVLFHFGKLDLVNLDEKFERAKFRPSVVQCGGKHIDGYIVVTGSGLVAVQLLKSPAETTSGQVYLNVPGHQRLADIRFTSQGKIMILISDGDIHSLVQFHELGLKYDAEERKLSFQVNVLPSFALQCSCEEQSTYTYISHAKFVCRERQDHVLVCLSGPSGSKFECWLLWKKDNPVHRTFQQTSVPSHPPGEATRRWKFVTGSSHFAKVLNFSIPAITMDSSTAENQTSKDTHFYCGMYVAVALADNTIQIVHRLFLESAFTQPLPTANNTTQGTTTLKQIKGAPSLRSVTFSPISCAVIALDTCGGLYCYKVHPWLDTPRIATTLQGLKQIVQLLLYCLVSGHDWWDVLLHVQPHLVDNVIEQITLELKRQPEHVQQVLKSRFLALKIVLYHISTNSASMDCHLKLIFDAVSLVFRSLVRPPQQVTAEENDPSVKLQLISRTSFETDINQLLLNVETEPQVLQSTQQLIQWVADVTLYLLASVPYHKQANRPGSLLLRDKQWLALLREMLVLIRVWGLLKSACSPVFHVLDSQTEILPHCFRLITLLWQTCPEDTHRKEIPTNLINECCLIPAQVIIPPLETITPINGILSHVKYSPDVKRLTFGEPQFDFNVHATRQNQLFFVSVAGSSGKVDSLRRVFLGKKPNQELKECTRCGVLTTYASINRPTLKVWDQRFVRSCLCGGLWKKVVAYD